MKAVPLMELACPADCLPGIILGNRKHALPLQPLSSPPLPHTNPFIEFFHIQIFYVMDSWGPDPAMSKSKWKHNLVSN